MAVFTSVEEADLAPMLERFALGTVSRLAPISEGIENTNYFLSTKHAASDEQHWVLTLFENLDAGELPYFCHLTRYLADAGFGVPAPLGVSVEQSLFQLNGRWAVIVPRLAGRSVNQPAVHHCAEIGRWLAEMHTSLASFGERRPLVRDLAWMKRQMQALETNMPDEEFAELAGYVTRYASYQSILEACPQGTVHGDLFHDNVLFDAGDKIGGVIDFYHACDATLLFDLAVVANDWALSDVAESTHARQVQVAAQGGCYNSARLEALTSAYQQVRPWNEHEQRAWPFALEVAALRFWVSRLTTRYCRGYQQSSVSGETTKDPGAMLRILRALAPHDAPTV